MLKSTNHICLSVRSLNDLIHLYRDILLGKLLLTGKKTAYLKLTGLWTTLNEKKGIPRNEIYFLYTHIALTIDGSESKYQHQRLKDNDVSILEGRVRDVRDRRPTYFTGPGGHKLELYTGTLENRLNYYKEAKLHVTFYK